jgi:Zn-dependent protease with chaperone function
MDFFAQQDKARKKTGRLVFLFVLAVVFIVAAVYAVAVVVLSFAQMKAHGGQAAPPVPLQFWQPQLFVTVAGMVVLVIFATSMFKMLMLRKGGSYVAESLGAQPVQSDTTDRDERKLLNVVEEIAIAAGVPVPAVYIMPNEQSINAFAAGWSPADAAIAVTAGCIQQLNRDELQGVIAHEFSHVLNGDMRLNISLIAFISGIMVLATIGYYAMWMRPRRSEKGNAAFMIAALSLVVIGYGGAFITRIIQSAVSRQREYLADASAVQFTRNPAGIANALKKIGGFSEGSVIKVPAAREVRHMFFGASEVSSFFGQMFASHPPLPQRIKLLDPSFDGDYSRMSRSESGKAGLASGLASGAASGFAGAAGGSRTGGAGSTVTTTSAATAARIGTLTSEQVEAGADLIARIPASVREAISEPLGACAVVCALLLDDDAGIRTRQLGSIGMLFSPGMAQETSAVAGVVGSLDRGLKLPVVDLALPALRRMSRAQYTSFARMIHELVMADSTVTLFEFCLLKVVEFRLSGAFEKPSRGTSSVSYNELVGDAVLLFSALARAGSEHTVAAGAAYAVAMKTLFAGRIPATIPGLQAPTFDSLNVVFQRMSVAPLKVRQALFMACSDCVLHDGIVTAEEAELLRAVAYCMGLPLPPFVAARAA